MNSLQREKWKGQFQQNAAVSPLHEREMVAKQDQFCRVLLGARAKAEKRVAQEPFALPYTANKTTVQILAERHVM